MFFGWVGQTRSTLLRGVAAVLAPAHLEVFTQKLNDGIHKFQRIHDDGHTPHQASNTGGTTHRDEKVANRDAKGLARRDRELVLE
jgi:hypothetical protein